jgi:hypothetical protein
MKSEDRQLGISVGIVGSEIARSMDSGEDEVVVDIYLKVAKSFIYLRSG